MVITSHGEGCFKLQSSGATLVTQALKGHTTAKLKADIFLKTSQEPADIGSDHYIKGPGEYEIKGIEVKGFPGNIYLIKIEDISFGYFGSDIPEGFDGISGLDILFSADIEQTVKIIKQLNPKIVLVSNENAKNLGKELGLEVEVLDKLSVKKKDLSEDAGAKLRLLSLKG